jgi:hypothetical protein
MIERSVQLDSNNIPNASKRAVRPTDLPTENRQRRMRHGEQYFPLFHNLKSNKFIKFSTIFSHTDGRAKKSSPSAIFREH